MKIVFMGTPDFSVPVLKQLVEDGYEVVGVVTQPDRPKGRKKTLTPPPVKIEAEKQGLAVFQPEKIRNEYKEIISLTPDLIVTAAYGQLLPKEILEAPKYGCINVHASLLPEYRGGAPIHYAIRDGKEKTGVTIMYMVEKLDAGDILTQVEVPILEEDHVGSLHNKLSAAGAKLLSETIPALVRGEIKPVAQDGEKVTFSPTIKREEELIDWTNNGEQIYNQIRGMHPWPIAYTTFENTLMKIWWGVKVPTVKREEPGRVIAVEDDGFVVASGNSTAIKVTECQPAGKKRMTAAQFLQGRKSIEGIKLGERNE